MYININNKTIIQKKERRKTNAKIKRKTKEISRDCP